MFMNPLKHTSIPKNMTNDESKLFAGLVCAQRELKVAEGKFLAYCVNRFKNEQS